MKEFLEIMLCMFATYGVYRFMHGIKALCSRRVRIVLALRVESECDKNELERKFGRVASAALNTDNAESEPVLLCEDTESARLHKAQGYSVYVELKD